MYNPFKETRCGYCGQIHKCLSRQQWKNRIVKLINEPGWTAKFLAELAHYKDYHYCLNCMFLILSDSVKPCQKCKAKPFKLFINRQTGEFTIQHGFDPRNVTVCLQCKEDYLKCPRCRTTIAKYYLYKDGCALCMPNHYPVNGHEYKPRNWLYFLAPNELQSRSKTFGMELEFHCGPGRNRDVVADILMNKLRDAHVPPYLCYIKHDGTVKPGFEVVTMPASYTFLRNSGVIEYCMDSMYDILPDIGGLVANHPMCGLHIHLGRNVESPVKNSDCFKMAAWCVANTPFLNRLGRREPNIKCRPIVGRSLAYQVKRRGGRHNDRYRTVNLVHRGTIEFRFFRMSLNAYDIYVALQFVDAISDYVKTISLRDYSLDPFLEFVAEQRSRWPELAEYIVKAHERFLQDKVDPQFYLYLVQDGFVKRPERARFKIKPNPDFNDPPEPIIDEINEEEWEDAFDLDEDDYNEEELN